MVFHGFPIMDPSFYSCFTWGTNGPTFFLFFRGQGGGTVDISHGILVAGFMLIQP